MTMNLIEENKLADEIKLRFRTAEVKIGREHRVNVTMHNDLIPPFLSFVKELVGFKHLSHMSCVDWIENNEFELVYILWNYNTNVQLITKTRINREKAEFESLRHFWPQLGTYEREIHEMYGINFLGHDNLTEFLLEDWDDMPPMRRDFDSIKFAQENFPDRSDARKDAQNVRETIAKHSGEEIPEFAKKYSIRNIDE